MLTKTTVRATAFLVGSIVLAACGGGAPTSSPGATQAPVATSAPATQAPGQTGAAPSLNLESFHAAVDLEALLPDSIGGEPIMTLSMSGTQFLANGMATEVQTALTALGKSASDLSVAFGSNSKVVIIAFQVKGVPGAAILEAFRQAYTADTPATVTDVTISGKAVKKFQPTDTSEAASWIYTKDDVVYTVGGPGTAPSDAVLTETFSKLP
jgi:hypothetical protein